MRGGSVRPWFTVGVLLAALTGSCLDQPAASASGWTEPVTVSAAHDSIDSIALAAGPRGEMVLWHADDLLPDGQIFGPPRAAFATASGEGQFSGERPLQSSFATAALVNLGPMWGSGRVAQLTFRRTGPSTSEPAVALGGVDGRFAPPLRVHAAVWAGRASLAGDAQGDLLLAWISSTRSGRRQVWVSVRHSGHSFQAPRLVSSTADAEQVTAAMGEGLHGMSANGFDADMAVAFASKTGRMLVSVRLHGQGWGSVQDVGQAAVGTVNGVAVAFGRSSRVVVAWYRQQLSEGGPLGPGITQVAVRPPDRHGFLAPQTLERDANASLAGTPALVANNGRGFLLAYVAQPGPLLHGFASSIVRVSYSKGNRFAPPQTVSPAGQQVSGVAAAEAPDGDIVTWSGGPNPPLTTLSPGAAIFAAVTDPLTGRLGAPVQVGPAEYAELATPIYAPYGQRWLLAWRGRQGTPLQSALGRVVVRVSSCLSQC
jgi:hypothetical protein